jgi:pimeloyl-ACP methyl ester carboxylesterase
VAAITLMLLPGLDGSGVLFRPLIRQLGLELQPVIVPYPPREVLGYDELLSLVLEALPRSSPFILLGESFSGPLALMAAATLPKGLRGVILCASSCVIRWGLDSRSFAISRARSRFDFILPQHALRPCSAVTPHLNGGRSRPKRFRMSVRLSSLVAFARFCKSMFFGNFCAAQCLSCIFAGTVIALCPHAISKKSLPHAPRSKSLHFPRPTLCSKRSRPLPPLQSQHLSLVSIKPIASIKVEIVKKTIGVSDLTHLRC